MPELPEVEVIRRGLEPLVVNRTIQTVLSDGKKLRTPVPLKEMKAVLPGRRITAVNRRAKYLLIELDDNSLLVIHLGMTGRLGLFLSSSEPQQHDHVRWRFDNDRELRFNDVRRFGSIHILAAAAVSRLEKDVIKNTGPEPFDQRFTGSYLQQKAQGRSRPVKSFIMDNCIVAGIGNIYANESLFAAALNPIRPVNTIGRQRWERLATEIRRVLAWAVECGGSTISDFLNAGGSPGYFQMHFKVYGRTGLACPVCSGMIRTIKIGGRASFYCDRCQK
ncbi:MAG: formamidopyrimidine-DNA glycosylase [Proteobacteria bacterium]|nr:MAG: formamidopyrimidine-DNA glycosylase [Pseudomonadota bacterium]